MNPSTLYRKVHKRASIWRRKRALQMKGISFFAPNYIFFERFDASSIVVDVGCGFEAELAIHLIEKFGVRAFGVDPTRKHGPQLERLAETSGNRFTHINKAVAPMAGTLVFHQSEQNESGSLFDDHANIQRDQTQSYEVETVTLQGLHELVERADIDLLKLDLEGAEYGLLKDIGPADLTGIKQLFIEFHHHCISRFTEADTHAIIDRIESAGMKSHTIDQHNYLFYW